MSKMSQLAMELDEQAVELGFKDREDAMDNGYEVMSDGNFARLVKTEDEQDKAHEAWLEEREEVFEMIDNMEKDIVDSVGKKEGHPRYWVDTLERIRAFVEKGEC